MVVLIVILYHEVYEILLLLPADSDREWQVNCLLVQCIPNTQVPVSCVQSVPLFPQVAAIPAVGQGPLMPHFIL